MCWQFIIKLVILPLSLGNSFVIQNGLKSSFSRLDAASQTLEAPVFITYTESGIRKSTTSTKVNRNNGTNDVRIIQQLTKVAIQQREKTDSLKALDLLGEMCSKRIPYIFENREHGCQMIDSVIEKLPQLIPQNKVKKICNKVIELEQKGLISTNPDSVDGLPSFHINLISAGQPVFSKSASDQNEQLDEFQSAIKSIVDEIMPILESKLVPKVNELLNSTTIKIDDVFIRRYGEDLSDHQSRLGISAHYDVYSKVTSVIALDDIGKDGTNGLYTVSTSSGIDSSSTSTSNNNIITNHASLRRFFPLASGDAVVHTWDVLHGVDVEPGLDRTSLIVWFVDEAYQSTTNATKNHHNVSPWLSSRPDLGNNNVAQFVLASAIQSTSWTPDGVENGKAIINKEDVANDQIVSKNMYGLLFKSVLAGNAFSLSFLGGLFADNDDDDEGDFNEKYLIKAESLLNRIGNKNDFPSLLRIGGESSSSSSRRYIARRFWYEAALLGVARAQISLADDIMSEVAEKYCSDRALFAGVLFALAAQQGDEIAIDALYRLVDYSSQQEGIDNEEDFIQSRIVQIARVACQYL